MRRTILTLPLWIFVCAISVAGQTVVESESSIVIGEKAADLSLTIEGKARTVDLPVEVVLLDAGGNVRASFSRLTKIQNGKRKYKFTIPVGDIMSKNGDEIAWWRLSYRVGETPGIVSLSELLRDDFDLRAAAFQRVTPGSQFKVRIRTLNPFTEKAVKGVIVTAELKLTLETDSDNNESIVVGKARTNSDGIATIDFKIPADIRIEDAEIVISAQKNGVVRKIEEDFDDDDVRGTALLTTDKPLYQPGQTFNVRSLLLDLNNTVVSGDELKFSVEDEDDTVVFRQTVTTSAFGIASISWPIPDNAKLGTYTVVVEADGDLIESQLDFKISRYNLPNFNVSAKPDKAYYLPTDTEARIDVAADYLFGKSVTSGKVRVVREGKRRWNYREQKYDVEEGTAVEGETSKDGRFVAKIDIREQIAELRNSEWRRFEDLSFAAYYTDLTTNRTEQRRFDIRLTKEPIHIYLVRHSDQHPELPLTAYVSTFYADGTPAVCNVEINDSKETVERFKTNALGAGKLEIGIPRERVESSRYDIRIAARDKKGQLGTYEESYYLSDDNAIQIRTDKTIYKPGEMIEIELRSTQRKGIIYVDVVRNWMPVDSRLVELNSGKARLTVPYKSSFKGDLVIAAYTDKEDGRWSNEMRAVRGIIFPEQQNLQLDAKFSKNVYRPAEPAKVMFAVRDGSQQPVESAIGLGIFDKAIEERARTDAEFGGYFDRFYRLLGYDRAFGSTSLKDLNDLDLSRPISPEMQLAAEIMLAGNRYFPTVYHSRNTDAEAKELYRDLTAKQTKELADAIQGRFKKDHEHPIDQASLERILREAGIGFGKFVDPWGQPYVADFSTERTQNIITIKTNGPDKLRGTADDFSVWSSSFTYFTQTGSAIDEVVRKYLVRTGRHIRDLNTFIEEWTKSGYEISRLKDRWGRDYRIDFEISGRNYVIRFTSNGPNGFAETSYRGDDFEVWKTQTNYFSEVEKQINRILNDEVNLKKKPFPRSETEFTEMLSRGRLDLAAVKDGYDRLVYVFAFIEPRFTNQTKVEYGKTTVVPVTEEMMMFKIRGKGADPDAAWDDVDLATFSGAITDGHRGTGFAKIEVESTAFTGAKGAIGGTITDPNGAVIPNIEITATNEADETQVFAARSNDEGKYLLANLPSGVYTLKVVSQYGFMGAFYKGLHVRSQTLLQVNVSLQVGSVAQTVEVTVAAGEQVNTTDAAISRTVTKTDFKIQFPYSEQTSTPRLRAYFPESLVWQPELLTDKKGKAELAFQTADNITTWKMFAIASDKKGKVGVVEKEITAFQAFFADLDPPKFLTEGDEIYLPTQVRNYTDKKQRVNVTMDKADWFSLLGSGKQQIDVVAGESQNAVFGFKATTPVKDGKQRVTAIAETDSDAIEKPVTVRPNGQEIVQTDSKYFTGNESFEITFPTSALPKTQKAELKIYPNLFSHVAESVEGLLQRPYGCGEQTISSTYPNLMILKFAKPESPIAAKAKRYLQKGYERLLGYQVADGGFTYWGGKDTSDIALTAYALRFLNDASTKIEVDDQVIKRAEDWLMRQQRVDGSWTKLHRWDPAEDAKRTKLTTTYVARSLAMSKGADKNVLTKALAYLRTKNSEIDEPYAMALFGLASLDAGDIETAASIAGRLESMAIAEGNAVYWKLESNTPFYGWGTAGRIETTALVTQLLIRSRSNSELISKAMLFLLKNKDRYGVWHSTQTTINVLDTFLAAMSESQPGASQTLSLSVNGNNLPPIQVPADKIDPIMIDMASMLNPEKNRIEVKSSISAPLMTQVVASHYLDWKDAGLSSQNVNQSRALRLDYKCDKMTASIMEDVTCSVSAERIGFQGYGMLLAEIGTPPGADVSRESLEKAIESDWSISRYDILPDRVVLYMWSKAGGTNFNFKFRPRYGINAQSPSSIVYDYYNPEARAVVGPLRFAVK